jgi:hypothetical protein
MATSSKQLTCPTNTRKSVNHLVALLHVLGCEVDVVVTPRSAA